MSQHTYLVLANGIKRCLRDSLDFFRNQKTRKGQDSMKSLPTNRGLICRQCGESRFRVIYTRARSGGLIVRRRECRKCGERLTSWERAIGQDSRLSAS
jgi:hypothetical protein